MRRPVRRLRSPSLMARVLVGLSGGVDSAAAALLLKEQGHQVTGAYCVMHSRGERELRDAKAVAHALGLPLLRLDLRAEFADIVLHNFLSEYAAGRTPNPCVLCNPSVKFAALCACADRYGIERVATGHYAGIKKRYNRYSIRTSPTKDQSYMLSRLPQSVLARLELPLFGRDKAELRAMAAGAGLPVADKPDSQELCFAAGGYRQFLIERGLPVRPGRFVLLETGEQVGTHDGMYNFTIGQRKNLGVALGEPVYVHRLDPESGDVFLSPRQPMTETAVAAGLAWQMHVFRDGDRFDALVKTRYAAAAVPAHIALADGRAYIRFESPVRAVTPGQTAVFYDKDAVIGAGFLE